MHPENLESCHIHAVALQPARGVVGRNKTPTGGQPVLLYYSNPDIIYAVVYANEFPAPCFRQACFAAALDAVYTIVNLVAFGCRTHA